MPPSLALSSFIGCEENTSSLKVDVFASFQYFDDKSDSIRAVLTGRFGGFKSASCRINGTVYSSHPLSREKISMSIGSYEILLKKSDEETFNLRSYSHFGKQLVWYTKAINALRNFCMRES